MIRHFLSIEERRVNSTLFFDLMTLYRIFIHKFIDMEPLQHRIDTLSNWLKTAGNESVVTQFERLQQELNKVVGYEVDGSPITTAKLLVDIATAEQQISEGKFTSHDDLEKESENW